MSFCPQNCGTCNSRLFEWAVVMSVLSVGSLVVLVGWNVLTGWPR